MIFCDSCGNSADRFLVTILSRSSWVFRLPVEVASRKKFSKRDDVYFIPVQFSFIMQAQTQSKPRNCQMGPLNTCVNYLANLKLCLNNGHELWKPGKSTAYCVAEGGIILGPDYIKILR